MARSGDNLATSVGLGALLALGGWYLWSRYLTTSSRVVSTGDDTADPIESLRRLFNPQNVAPGTGSAQQIPAVQPAAGGRGVFMDIDPNTIPLFGRWRDPQ
jgi:hypothetical protein